MGKRIGLLLLLGGGIAAALCLAGRWSARSDATARPVFAAPPAAAGFTRATGDRPLTFPTDFGPHPDFQTEWWYYTGNLATAEGRRFGYQLTFFRRALLPPSETPSRASAWGSGQAYLAHFALSDIQGGQHQAVEQFSRGALGLAGAAAAPFAVWLDDWEVRAADGTFRLRARQPEFALDLRLVDRKGPILQGDRGLSQKGPERGQASYYYSLTRLETAGTLTAAGVDYAVSGWSWMDHEFSTSVLSANQVGWDWFSLQLDDGRELMVFQIRQQAEDGRQQVDPYSSGTLVAADGATQALTAADFTIRPLGSWRSPHSGATYPSGWELSVPSAGLTLTLEPLLRDQELNLAYSYWEGAVKISGAASGWGYVELTGYAGPMGGEF